MRKHVQVEPTKPMGLVQMIGTDTRRTLTRQLNGR